MNRDPSLSDAAAYGSIQWCADTLGKTRDWFRKNRPALEADGFPRVDRLVGLTLKSDVHAWLARRRRVTDGEEHHTPRKGEHLHAL
jgi:hypothetical protein